MYDKCVRHMPDVFGYQGRARFAAAKMAARDDVKIVSGSHARDDAEGSCNPQEESPHGHHARGNSPTNDEVRLISSSVAGSNTSSDEESIEVSLTSTLDSRVGHHTARLSVTSPRPSRKKSIKKKPAISRERILNSSCLEEIFSTLADIFEFSMCKLFVRGVRKVFRAEAPVRAPTGAGGARNSPVKGGVSGFSTDDVSFPYSVYARFVDLAKRSHHMEACLLLIDHVESVGVEDVPLRDAVWSRLNRCSLTSEGEQSTAYGLEDWKYCRYTAFDPSPGFMSNIKAFVGSAAQCVLIQERMGELASKLGVDKDVVRQDVSSNPYVIYAVENGDEHFGPFSGNEEFFKNVYVLRQYLGLPLNGKYQEFLHGFVGEGGAYSSPDVATFVDEERVMAPNRSFADIVQSMVDRFWSMLQGLTSLVSRAYDGFLESLRKFLTRSLVKLFRLDELAGYVTSNDFRDKFAIAIAIMILFFCVGSYILGRAFGFGIVSALSKINESRKFVAEAEISPASLLTSALIALYGLKNSDADSLRKKAMYMMSLVAGGTLVANAGACCFTLMPQLFQDAVLYKFGSEEQRLKREVDEWRSVSNALIQFSKIAKVVISDYYLERVQEAMKAGSDLQSKLFPHRYTAMRNIVVMTFVRLQKIQYHINAYKTSGVKRPEPFCIHIAGPSGIGKTLIADRLVKETCDAVSVYTRNGSEEHWNGYACQDAALLDEWLVGSQDKAEREAGEFLTLVSSSSATLNMATLDDPFVGIKGTKFESRVLVTLNNTLHNRVAGFDTTALQRRRDVVLQVAFREDYMKYVKEDKLDFSSIPPEDVRNKRWFKCRIVRSIFSADFEATATQWCSYQVAVRSIRERYLRKKALQDVMRESDLEIGDDGKSADELINEELRKTCSMPDKPLGVLESIGQILGFVAEAPRRHNHHCVCGAPAVRHNVGDNFRCGACGGISSCVEAPNETDADRVNVPTVIGDCGPGAHFHACPMRNCTYKSGCHGTNDGYFECNVHGKVKADTGTFSHQAAVGVVVPPEMYEDYDEWCRAVFMTVYDSIGSAWDMNIGEYERAAGEPWTHTPKVLLLVGVLSGAMVALARWFSGGEAEEITYSSESPDKDKTSHKQKRRDGRWKRQPKISAEASRVVEVVNLDLGHLVVKAIPISGKWLMTYAHGLFDNGNVIPEGRELVLDYKNHSYKWNVVPDNVIMCRDPVTDELERDVAFIRFDCPQLPQFKNSKSLFASEKDIPDVRFRVSLKSRDRLIFSEAKPERNVYSYEGMQLQLNDGFMYQAETAAGDCGTPVLMAQGSAISKCVGIHVAGTVTKDFPFGLATRVTREMIEEVLETFSEDYVAEAPHEFLERLASTENPNLKEVRVLTKCEKIHMTSKTKLAPSAISRYLNWKTEKAPAIMSISDPRSKGLDPVEEAIATLAAAPKVLVDTSVLAESSVELLQELEEGLDYSLTGGMRELTFEEAVFGVPGALSGLDTSTHSGYPYCYFVDKRGKRSLIWHEEGEGRYHPDFKFYCLQQLERVKNGEDIDKVFVGFMKDEVRSKTKIEKVSTRITYSNDVSYNVVCRMLFGSMVAAFNHSFPSHGYALGINPSSYDAGKIFHRLRTSHDRLVAGDFGEFDLRHQRQIMDESFSVLGRLGASLPLSSVTFEHVRKHETTVPLHIGPYAIRTVANNASGGFWTTILNCITADLYFRYAWKVRYPTRRFSDYVKAVILGDDHILAIHEMAEWNPLMIRDDMLAVGQLYTSAWKDQDLTENYLKFDEVMFLGNYFRLVDGRWSGALRKETLRESVTWTRNSNLTIYEECRQMVEYASQWDKEFFTEYLNEINNALECIGFPKLDVAPWLSLRKMVANRTSESMVKYAFVAQAGNLTKIDESTAVPETNVVSRIGRTLQDRTLNDAAADLSKGTDSLIMRNQLDWSTSSGVGTVIYNRAIPFDVLGQGDQHNLQNMAFQNFLYSEPDVEITIQINGSPTHCGMLCLFLVPLIDVVPDVNTWPSMTHVMVNPNVNTTATVVLPFKYWKSLLDNQDSHYAINSIAWVKLGVYSPLVTKSLPSTCGVVVFSRFKTRVYIPRQMAPAPNNTRPVYGFTAGTGAKIGNIYAADTTFIAQGNISSTNVTNTYSMGDVAGSVPNETTMEIGGQAAEGKLTVPMDNPPIVGGGIPTVAQFPSMSRSNGPVPTTGMSLHPQEMSRQAMLTRDPLETNIAALCAREGRLLNFSWTTAQADGYVLQTIGMGTWISAMDGPTSFFASTPVPFNVWLLNEFKFARYDVVFKVTAVRTNFHSGRIIGSVYYGVTPPTNNSAASVYNTVMDFNGDNMVQEMRIPYNNTQEYVRANDNSAATSNYRPGLVKFTVLNELRTASEIVPTTIDVIISVRFENVRVAVPNPYSTMSIAPQSRMNFVAQAGTPRGKGAEIGEQPEEVTTGTSKGANTPQVPCKVVLGEKFEYNITDIHELLRRYVPIPPSSFSGFPISNFNGNYTAWRVPVYLTNQFANVYAGWSGTIKFRIFVYSSTPAMVMHIPTNRTSNGSAYSDVDYSMTLLGAETSFMQSATVRVTSAYWPTFAAREMTMPLTSNSSWIDVSVPFCTELNYLPNQDRGLSTPQIGPWGNGYLWIRTSTDAKVEIFQAAGDDFRYHGFCPSPGIERRIAVQTGIAPPTTGRAYQGIFS